MILDTSACQVAQPFIDCSPETIGFVVAPSIVNHNTITEHTTDENSYVAQIDRVGIMVTKRDSKEVTQYEGLA